MLHSFQMKQAVDNKEGQILFQISARFFGFLPDHRLAQHELACIFP